MNTQSSINFLIGILVVAVIAIVGYLAYSQGYFDANEEQNNGIQLEIGSNDTE